MHELITLIFCKKWWRNEKLFIRNGPWLVPTPRVCPGRFWEAAGQHGPKLSQDLCSDSVLDNCKVRVPGHVSFWFTGSTVREHKEYYFFFGPSDWDGCRSSVHPCCHLIHVGFAGRCVHGSCAARRVPCCGPGAEAAVAEGPTSSFAVRLFGGAASVHWCMAGRFL